MLRSHSTDAETVGKFIAKATGLGRERVRMQTLTLRLPSLAMPVFGHCLRLVPHFLRPWRSPSSRNESPVLSPQAPSLISGFWDTTTNALIWTLQRSAFSSRSLGSSQEGSVSKEGGNQNKVKSMASQLLAKFEESSRNPSLLKQVSPITCPHAAFLVTRTEKPAEIFRLVMDFRYASHTLLKQAFFQTRGQQNFLKGAR